MPKKRTTDHLTPKDVAAHAYQWTREQMEEMKAIIDGLLATAAESTDNPPQEGEAPGGKSPQRRKLAGGSIEEKTINGCGPYRYLRYRHQGKYKSVYVGKLEAGRGGAIAALTVLDQAADK